MATWAYITRATPATSSGTSIEARPYKLSRPDGTTYETYFASVHEAEAMVDRQAGRRLRWVREDRNGIECYRGEDA